MTTCEGREKDDKYIRNAFSASDNVIFYSTKVPVGVMNNISVTSFKSLEVKPMATRKKGDQSV